MEDTRLPFGLCTRVDGKGKSGAKDDKRSKDKVQKEMRGSFDSAQRKAPDFAQDDDIKTERSR
jgi:hypothetical protein